MKSRIEPIPFSDRRITGGEGRIAYQPFDRLAMAPPSLLAFNRHPRFPDPIDHRSLPRRRRDPGRRLRPPPPLAGGASAHGLPGLRRGDSRGQPPALHAPGPVGPAPLVRSLWLGWMGTERP